MLARRNIRDSEQALVVRDGFRCRRLDFYEGTFQRASAGIFYGSGDGTFAFLRSDRKQAECIEQKCKRRQQQNNSSHGSVLQWTNS
jgi:hypothetical protein